MYDLKNNSIYKPNEAYAEVLKAAVWMSTLKSGNHTQIKPKI